MSRPPGVRGPQGHDWLDAFQNGLTHRLLRIPCRLVLPCVKCPCPKFVSLHLHGFRYLLEGVLCKLSNMIEIASKQEAARHSGPHGVFQ